MLKVVLIIVGAVVGLGVLAQVTESSQEPAPTPTPTPDPQEVAEGAVEAWFREGLRERSGQLA